MLLRLLQFLHLLLLQLQFLLQFLHLLLLLRLLLLQLLFLLQLLRLCPRLGWSLPLLPTGNRAAGPFPEPCASPTAREMTMSITRTPCCLWTPCRRPATSSRWFYPDGMHGYRGYQGEHDKTAEAAFWTKWLLQ